MPPIHANYTAGDLAAARRPPALKETARPSQSPSPGADAAAGRSLATDKVQLSQESKQRVDQESSQAGKAATSDKPVDKAAMRDEMVQALKSGDTAGAKRAFNAMLGRETTTATSSTAAADPQAKKPVDKETLRDEMVQALKSGDNALAKQRFNEMQKMRAAEAYR